MAKQIVNVGSEPNDPAADDIRTSFQKVNSNTEEIYGAGPVDTNVKVFESTITTVELDSDLIIEASGNGVIQMPTQVNAGRINCDILNVVTNFNAGEIDASFIDVANIDVSLHLRSDLITSNTLTVDNDTTLNNDVIINLGPGNSLVVTDGDAVVPTNYLSIDGNNGNTIIEGYTSFGNRINVDLDLDEPDEEGEVNDKRGDIIYTEDYIYLCFEDWEKAIPPATQPTIWTKFSSSKLLGNIILPMKTDIATSQTDITTSQTDITTLQSEVSTLQSEVLSMESRITALEALSP